MFDTSFSHASATPLPPNLSIDEAINILHDFDTVIRLSPDCRGSKQIPHPTPSQTSSHGRNNTSEAEVTYHEVEDGLPFIPKRLWSGGVHYHAEFTPVSDGCDITIHAPGNFQSTNYWRLLRETAPTSNSDYHPSSLKSNENPDTIPKDELNAALQKAKTRDLLHADRESDGAGWYVEIISDAKCSKVYASFVKSFLKNSHGHLQHAFINRLREVTKSRGKATSTAARPTLGRRRSSVL